jgi:nicotinate-nucleotide pyrophosphorylase (carboxylating)
MENRYIDPLVRAALDEDLAWGDVTTDNLINPQATGVFSLVVREDGVLAGLPVAARVFAWVEPALVWTPLKVDGEHCRSQETIARISGSLASILKGERVALNLLQRLSGIATLTDRYVQAVRGVSKTVRVVDTRKTTPGMRYLEKYAVRMGGGHNHRYCLSDAVMIKDNHLACLRRQGIGLEEAVAALRLRVSHTVRIEIEVDTLSQIESALAAGADIILLDNMTCRELADAVRLIGGKALTEASGGVRLETVADIAATGVDIISAGALTHSAPALDIGLDMMDDGSL